jgi:hypothetical protein
MSDQQSPVKGGTLSNSQPQEDGAAKRKVDEISVSLPDATKKPRAEDQAPPPGSWDRPSCSSCNWLSSGVLQCCQRCRAMDGEGAPVPVRQYLRAVANVICADPDRSLPPPPSSPLSAQPARKTATICKRRSRARASGSLAPAHVACQLVYRSLASKYDSIA